MMAPGGGKPTALCSTLVVVLSLAAIIGGITGQTIQPCPNNELPPSNVLLGFTISFCQQVPLDDGSTRFTIWYHLENTTNVLSAILSVPKESAPRWYGMGFNSKPSSMPGTQAIIFWETSSKPVWNKYRLSKPNSAGVTQDSKLFSFTSPPTITDESNNLYLSFKVTEQTPGDFASQNFVVGAPGDTPSGADFTAQNVHQGKAPVQINFQTGTAVFTTSNVDSKKRTHGILNIIGWGVLLPIGAIVARYARGFDPHWFYVHAVSQIVGYSLVLAGLITGSQLLDQLPGIDVGSHKALGIFLFVLATIQLSAVVIRPRKEAKLRRYWNWCHGWMGRVALVIGTANIFVGIHLASASSKWRIGYGIVLGLELLVVVVLEIMLWTNYAKSKHEPHLPQTAMQDRAPNGGSAPPPPSATNWDGKP